jgi:hypothetical protein
MRTAILVVLANMLFAGDIKAPLSYETENLTNRFYAEISVYYKF